MLIEIRTPEKLFIIDSENSSTVKREKDRIFPSSASKPKKTWLSERRYIHQAKNELDLIDPVLDDHEIKSNKLLLFNPHHKRTSSQTRNRSIGDPEETSKNLFKKEASTRNTSKAISIYTEDSKSPIHRRNISDGDSVIYIEPEEKRQSELGGFSFQIGSNKNPSFRSSISVLGNAPCTAYCRYCKTDVHTKVEFCSAQVPGSFLRLASSIFSCCSGPIWLNCFKVHKCPNCSLVLAKCR